MAGEVTNIRLSDLQAIVSRMEERLSVLEVEKVRNESLTAAVTELKILMGEHMRSSMTKSEGLEKRMSDLQIQMMNEINKLQKAVLIAVLGGAGAGATAMKLASLFLGVG